MKDGEMTVVELLFGNFDRKLLIMLEIYKNKNGVKLTDIEKALGISKPTLLKLVRELEDSLMIKRITIKPAKFVLTDFGLNVLVLADNLANVYISLKQNNKIGGVENEV